jgi:protein required for attachment to host cells
VERLARTVQSARPEVIVKHWILIADAASCAIYSSDEALAAFAEVRRLDNEHVHPERDALGPRGSTRAGPGGVHARFERHSDPQDAERARFAHSVALLLDEALGRGEFERLVIVAPPRFLGELRADLSARVARHVAATVDRDLARTPIHELPEAVRRHLPATAGMDL